MLAMSKENSLGAGQKVLTSDSGLLFKPGMGIFFTLDRTSAPESIEKLKSNIIRAVSTKNRKNRRWPRSIPIVPVEVLCEVY